MKTKRWLIRVLMVTVVAAALVVPLTSVGAPPSQAYELLNGSPTPFPTSSPTPVLPLGESSNDVGVGKDVYTVDEIVYATGSGFPGNSFVDVYIVPDRTWTPGEAIPLPDVSGGPNNVPTTGAGNLGPAPVWTPPLTPGDYDMVFDTDGNGDYDPPGDVVDGPNPAGFRVLGPVGGIVEPVDPLEPGAASGESADVTSTTTFIALGIGMAVLFATFLVWYLRRRGAASAGKNQ